MTTPTPPSPPWSDPAALADLLARRPELAGDTVRAGVGLADWDWLRRAAV